MQIAAVISLWETAKRRRIKALIGQNELEFDFGGSDKKAWDLA